jgi:hypothetical protein
MFVAGGVLLAVFTLALEKARSGAAPPRDR